MSTTPKTRFARSVLLGVLAAQFVNLVEGIVQAVVHFAREPQEWVHSVVVYGWAGLAVGALIGLVLPWIERALPNAWRGRLAGPLAFAFFALLVSGYWLNVTPAMPSFTTWTGKALTAGLALAILAIAVGGGWLLGRRGQRVTDRGFALERLLAAGVLVFLLLTWPLVPTRPVPQGPALPEIEASGELPPIVVLCVDTLRRDHLGFYGYERDTSPNLDALAARSIVFDASNTTGNFTIPATASFFTGLYPSGHGTVHPHDRFPADVPTINERLRSIGYRTAAFVGNPTMRAEMGYARGFDHFYPEPPPGWIYHRRTAIELVAARFVTGGDVSPTPNLVRRALEWMDRDDPRAPFLYLHLMDPHSGYVPPREYFEPFLPEGVTDGPAHPPRLFDYYEDEWIPWEDLEEGPQLTEAEVGGMVARYDGEIRYVDEWIGRFVDGLDDQGVFDDAIFVFVSDHGEEFGDHDGWFHGDTLYAEMVDMPFFLKLPRDRYAGARTTLAVDLVDVPATIEGLLGFPPAPGRQGVDLSHEMLVVASGSMGLREVEPQRLTFYERPPRLYGLEWGSLKFIRRTVQGEDRVALFDLAADPGETNDLARRDPVLRLRMEAMVDSVLADVVRDPGAGAGTDEPVDPETLRALRSLGYVE